MKAIPWHVAEYGTKEDGNPEFYAIKAASDTIANLIGALLACKHSRTSITADKGAAYRYCHNTLQNASNFNSEHTLIFTPNSSF